MSDARVDGIFINVSDFEKMFSFYRDTLGFRVKFSIDHFAELATDSGATVALHAGREGQVRPESHWFLHCTVKDIEITAAALRSCGVEVSPIQDLEYVGKVANFKDPEGNTIGLEQPLE